MLNKTGLEELTSENVTNTIRYCLFKKEELVGLEKGVPPPYALIVDLTPLPLKVAFHPDRLLEKKELIRGFLAQLPDFFQSDLGGGHTFLNAYLTASDRHWGEHRNIGELCALGVGLGLIKMQNDLFGIPMPGGMPYIIPLEKFRND